MRVDASVSEATEQAVRRISVLWSDGVEPRQAITVAISIAEAHVDETILALIEHHDHRSDQLLGYLVDQAGGALRETWPKRREVLKHGFGVECTQGAQQRMDLVIDVRNALAHGDGALTDRQLATWGRAFDLRGRLVRELGVDLHGRKLTVDRSALAKSLSAVREYLIELDVSVSRSSSK